jgi:hypothetical protein
MEMTNLQLIKAIAERAVRFHEQRDMQAPPWRYIASELQIVHGEIVPLRLSELLDSDEKNFAHDIGGSHKHLRLGGPPELTLGFTARFAK